MMQTLIHRGPDGTGEYVSSEGSAWLGHLRLAIIDPEGGKQPLSNEDDTIWITFNGCIYNYLELAQRLRQKGHKFRTYSDTEVIVHAYEEYGVECVKQFIGMFAFAIWDGRKKVLFCARDRVGVKPFYYSQKNDVFIFASEIKAILASGRIEASPCHSSIQEYITFQTSISEQTMFNDVHRLLPGYYMTVNSDGHILSMKKYWDLSFEAEIEHHEDYFVDHLRLLLKDAVKIRLRSDVPLGSHLSGGLDSSAIACLAADNSINGETLKCFNGAFDEGIDFDETRYARLVADSIHADFFQIRPKADDFKAHLQKIIYYMDEPAAGPGIFPQYMVSRLASEHVKVVLGGQGGDEIFGGYARYLVGYLEECLKGAIEKTADTGLYAATLSTIIPSLPMLQQYIPMLKTFWADGLFEPQERRYFRLMDRSAASKEILHSDYFSFENILHEKFDRIFLGSNAASFLNRMLYFDLKVHLPALLHVEDRTSMAWGLESRVPLLDHRICELLAKIPVTIKFKNGHPKYLFRKAIKNIIPDNVLNREDKMGFPVPLHKWYRNELKQYVRDILLDNKVKQRGIYDTAKLEQKISTEQSFGRAIWGALCLELWFRTFMDQS